LRSRIFKAVLALLGIAAFAAFGIILENETGFPMDTTYRIACAAACLFLMAKAVSEYPGQKWPLIALLSAMMINCGLFLTPLFDRPASRGEILMFALPDATVFTAARAASYPVADEHQRAVRQQLVVGVILAVALSALIFASALVPDRDAKYRGSIYPASIPDFKTGQQRRVPPTAL